LKNVTGLEPVWKPAYFFREKNISIHDALSALETVQAHE